MEKGSRVQEMRKRFEGLNSLNDDSPISKSQLSSDHLSIVPKLEAKATEIASNNGIKSVIKRSHAFRSDKSKIKPFVNSIATFDSECLTVKDTSKNINLVPNGLHTQQRVTLLKHVLKPPNISKPQNSINKSATIPDNLSDTLKKALKNPLPSGPAPRKPPRTFAHLGRSLDLEDNLRSSNNFVSNKLTESVVVRSNENCHPNVVGPRRSKTEPHIMLKKLESALLSNQLNNSINVGVLERKSLPAPQVSQKQNIISSNNNYFPKTKSLCLNGFSSCIAAQNIYDNPFEPSQTFSKGLCPKKNVTILPLKCAYGSIQKKRDSHIYEEPYSPRNERKFGVINNKNEQPVKTPSPEQRSVHYMSSPIREVKRISPIVKKVQPSAKIQEKIKMITDAFNESAKFDSDADSLQEEKTGNHEAVTAVRKGYVKRVSTMRLAAPKTVQGKHLFEALLLIGLDQDLLRGKFPYIKTQFPESASLPERIEELVFPDAGDWPPVISLCSRPHNNYNLCLTAEDGSRKYAYCRRLQPEGIPFCFPLAYVIITPHRDNSFYYSILEELESRHGVPEADFLQFVKNLNHSILPKPGSCLRIGDTVINRLVDPREESYDISRLLESLSAPIFIKIFSSLLIERRVILIGSNISIVSNCVEGLQKCLFPFEWEHTIIGAVPSNMLELCTAPTPFLMGVIRPKENPQSANFLPLSSIDNCLVADVDTGEIIFSCGDENSLLPQRLSSCLRSALILCSHQANDIGPSEALIRLFVELFGHYNNHVITDAITKVRTFQRESFIKAPKSRSLQLFLEWFTETAMFQCFIQKRLDRSFEPGLFEQRCAEYIEENLKNHNLTKKEKSFNKTVKIIGDRFKDWTSSS